MSATRGGRIGERMRSWDAVQRSQKGFVQQLQPIFLIDVTTYRHQAIVGMPRSLALGSNPVPVLQGFVQQSWTS